MTQASRTDRGVEALEKLVAEMRYHADLRGKGQEYIDGWDAATRRLVLAAARPDPALVERVDVDALLQAMYSRLPYSNWTLDAQGNAAAVAAEYDRIRAVLTAAEPAGEQETAETAPRCAHCGHLWGDHDWDTGLCKHSFCFHSADYRSAASQGEGGVTG